MQTTAKQRNRLQDIQFAADISHDLVATVRRLQNLLTEQDGKIKLLEIEKSKLETRTESRLKLLDEAEQRYKEENWNLESRLQDLRATVSFLKDVKTNLTVQINTITTEKNPLPLRIVTHNIRYAPAHLSRGEKPWATRFPLLISQFHHLASSQAPTIICLQEVLHHQLLDILTNLNSNLPQDRHWASVGVHRDDGKFAGEASPILYQPSVFKMLSNHTTWLSPTPETPSRGWDAACTRIITHGTFEHIPSGRQIVFMSTHFDHQGSKSRLHAANIIIELVASYRKLELPIVLCGDFNSEVTQEAYKRLAAQGSGVVDVKDCVERTGTYGETNTYTGFGHEEKPDSRIDFIFVNDSVDQSFQEGEEKAKKEWKVNGYAVMPNTFKDEGIFMSDHRAVVADLELE